MTFDELFAFLERVTYKPNTKLVAKCGPTRSDGKSVKLTEPTTHYSGNVMLALEQSVPSARPRDGAGDLVILASDDLSRFHVEHIDERDLLRVVRKLVRRAEMHEVDEWLRIDGDHVTVPHPDLPDDCSCRPCAARGRETMGRPRPSEKPE